MIGCSGGRIGRDWLFEPKDKFMKRFNGKAIFSCVSPPRLLLYMLLGSIPAAYAANGVDGALQVSMQVSSTCTVPSPSGNLTLPFDGGRVLTNQVVSYSVTITSTCTSGSVITALGFGDGIHYLGDGASRVRRMENANSPGTFLAYQMYRDNTGNGTLIKPESYGDCTGANATDCSVITYAPTVSSISQKIYGRIYDNTGTYANQYAVMGGIYNDSVVMTVTYN